MANAIEQIYNQIADVLGGTNTSQVLTMAMPGTSLDAKTYAYDTTQMKPAIVQEAEARLADQMFDIAKVSGTSNAQRVSSQYLQALSVLTPNFNPIMPVLKETMRDFLNTPMPANTMLDGVLFVGTLQQYYFRLYDNYIAVKLAWEKQIIDEKAKLSLDPDTEDEKFLEWYEQIAEAELAKIDEALGKVLGVVSPADMDAILGALAAGPGGELYEATNTVQDVQLASPDGGFFYPVELTPNDWFLDLASDVNPANLLQDPAFIAATISTKRQALMASISQVQAMLNNMPTKGDIKLAAEDLQKAQGDYTTAQNNLLSTYADNTATAVEIYLQKHNDNSQQSDGDIKNELDSDARQVSKAKGEQPVATGAKKKNGAPITAADVQQIVAGQKTLIGAQAALQTSAQAVADAGMNLASQQASYFGDLPVILARMIAQLADLTNLQTDLGTAIVTQGNYPLPVLGPVIPQTSMKTASAALVAANVAAAATAATASDVVTAVTTAVGGDTNLKKITDAASSTASSSSISIGTMLITLNTAVASLADETDITDARKMVKDAQDAADADGATAATVYAAIEADATTPALKKIADQCANDQVASANDVVTAVSTVVNQLVRAPQAQKSDASQRFMELQMSFSTSDMESKASSDSSFSQTSWSVDLFFGSASGSSSSSSAVTAKNSFDSSTEIQVAFKAAKVDIERGWLNPGVFKLTQDMSRISSEPVSYGDMPVKPVLDGSGNIIGSVVDWTKVGALTKALFPSFPTAFIVVKDINITFKATESRMAALHTVLDSKAAIGGGFLCFSASKSSASHSDSSSTSIKTQGTTINISMPGPQILAWYLELTPVDKSQILSVTDAGPIGGGIGTSDINIVQFVKQLAALKGLIS